MDLENEFFLINEKSVVIQFRKRGYIVKSDEDLTLGELQLASAIAFVYIGARSKDIILDDEYLMGRANELYGKFHDGMYPGLRRLDEMSIEEFNKEVREWEKK